MKLYLYLIVSSLILMSCSDDQTQSFQVSKSADSALNLRADNNLPLLVRACPGLNRYSKDLSSAKISISEMRGYEGGIELNFKVTSQPQKLPAPLNVWSMQHNCGISINKEGTKAYIGKSACHSICEGKWQENSPDILGREFVLK